MKRALARLGLVTPLGWAVLTISLAAWAFGWWLGWVELFLGAATGLLTLALCGLFVLRREGKVRIELDAVPVRFKEGASAEVTVTVTNDAVVPSPAMELQVAVADTVKPFQVPSVGSKPWQESFPFPGIRRGVYQLGPATTVRGDPLGLFERRVRRAGEISLYVHPKTIPMASLGAGMLRDLEGQPTDQLSTSDLAFHTLREYNPGDDSRHIHWRSSAKSLSTGNKLLIRQFQDTRRTQLLVLVDGDESAYPEADDFELALSAGASVAEQAIKDGLELTVRVGDQEVRHRRGHPLTRDEMLDACARARLTRLTLDELVTAGLRRAPEATFALIVTGAKPTVSQLRRVCVKIPRQVRTAAIRVNPRSKREAHLSAVLTVLSLNKLEDVRWLMGRGSAG